MDLYNYVFICVTSYNTKEEEGKEMALEQLNIHMEKMNLDLYYIQKVTKMTLDLNIRVKTVKLLLGNVEEIFVPLG